KLFNVIMLRAGITLIITVAFSISSMLYSLTSSYPFFLIAFLQIVTFAGIYMKLGDIMSMFRLQSNDSQHVGRQVMRRPSRMLNRGSRRLQRTLGRTLAGATAGAAAGKFYSDKANKSQKTTSHNRANKSITGTKENKKERSPKAMSMGHKIGQMTGKAMDTKNRDRENIGHRKRQVRDLHVSTQYAEEQGKERIKRPNTDYKGGVTKDKEKREQAGKQRSMAHRQTIAQKRMEMERKRQTEPTSQKTYKQNRSLAHGKTNTKQTEQKQPFVNQQQQSIPEKRNQTKQNVELRK